MLMNWDDQDSMDVDNCASCVLDESPTHSGVLVYNGSGDSGSRKRGGFKRRRGKEEDQWKLAGPEQVPGPEFCPGAIAEYVSLGNKRASESLLLKARRHLRFLGWKIEVARYKGSNTCFRFRYTSPTTGNVYLSLRLLCGDLGGSVGADSSLVPDGAEQAADGSRGLKRGKRIRGARELGIEVEGHRLTCMLRSNNASRQQLDHQIAETKRREGEVMSPSKVQFDQPQVACKELSTEPMAEAESGKEAGKQIAELHCDKGAIENPIEIPDDAKELTSKTLAPTPLKRNPRTVLSWLIDNNVVSEGDKVHYRGNKFCSQLAAGRITREGIDCDCCRMVFSLSSFEAHAGSTNHRPAANILLEDGRTLMDCKKQASKFVNKGQRITKKPVMKINWEKRQKKQGKNDDVCSLCQCGGNLILCDNCLSSFHQSCLGLQNIPVGEWFCFSCCCHICGQFKLKHEIQKCPYVRILSCHQCQRNYHAGCVKSCGCELEREDGRKGDWFCSSRCKDLYIGLQELRNPVVAGGGLTWTLVKSSKANSHDFGRLNAALAVLHECFDPVKDHYTGRDIVENVIYGRGSSLKRMNCKGFYTVLLERDGDVITAAALRIQGDNVAEVPLVATRFECQRLGMCRILMNELEKQLVKLGVERLVLPAATSTVDTWVKGFGFTKLGDRNQYPGLVFMDFAGTVMCEKVLKTSGKRCRGIS